MMCFATVRTLISECRCEVTSDMAGAEWRRRGSRRVLGCAWQVVQLLNCDTEARAPRQQQPSAVYRIEDFTARKQSPEWHPTAYGRDSRQGMAAVFASWGREGRGKDVRLAHWLSDRPSVG